METNSCNIEMCSSFSHFNDILGFACRFEMWLVYSLAEYEYFTLYIFHKETSNRIEYMSREILLLNYKFQTIKAYFHDEKKNVLIRNKCFKFN